MAFHLARRRSTPSRWEISPEMTPLRPKLIRSDFGRTDVWRNDYKYDRCNGSGSNRRSLCSNRRAHLSCNRLSRLNVYWQRRSRWSFFFDSQVAVERTGDAIADIPYNGTVGGDLANIGTSTLAGGTFGAITYGVVRTGKGILYLQTDSTEILEIYSGQAQSDITIYRQTGRTWGRKSKFSDLISNRCKQ